MDAFSDPDQDDATLTFAVASVLPSGIVNVTASNLTDELTLDVVADGNATVTVTATDDGGATGYIT